MNRIEVEKVSAMTDASNPTTAVPDRPVESHTVESHTPCRQCGYDLHGLPTDGRCPECGVEVASSLGENLLVLADRKWLASLLSGARALELSFALVILLVVVGVALDASPLFDESRLTLFCLVLACIIACWAAGAWLLSAPDPSGRGEREYGLARRIARWAAVLGAMQGLFDCAAAIYATRLGSIIDAVATETVLAQIIGVVGVFAHLHYFQNLLLRTPNLGMVTLARSLKFTLSGLWASFYFVTLLELLAVQAQIGLGALAVFGLILGLLGLLGGVVYLGFIIRLERCLAAMVWEARTKI